jgi:hypothetical protein
LLSMKEATTKIRFLESRLRIAENALEVNSEVARKRGVEVEGLKARLEAAEETTKMWRAVAIDYCKRDKKEMAKDDANGNRCHCGMCKVVQDFLTQELLALGGRV